jgi:hypothetical protein
MSGKTVERESNCQGRVFLGAQHHVAAERRSTARHGQRQQEARHDRCRDTWVEFTAFLTLKDQRAKPIEESGEGASQTWMVGKSGGEFMFLGTGNG